MFGLVFESDGQNEGPLNNGSDIYCSACSPLVCDNLGLFHMWCTGVCYLEVHVRARVFVLANYNYCAQHLMPGADQFDGGGGGGERRAL